MGSILAIENKCTTIMQAFNMRLLKVLITGWVYCRMKPWRYCKGIEIARILTIAHFDILQSLFYSKKRGIVQTRGSHLRYFCTGIQPVYNWLHLYIYIYMDVALYEMLSISCHFFSLIYPSYFISINETMKWVFKVLSNNITDIATRFIALVAIQVMPVLQAYSMWATYVISTFKTVVILDIFYQRKWYTNKHTDSKWTEHRHYTYQ